MEGKQGQTEKATQKRRSDERNKGRLPLSAEVVSVSVLLMSTFLLRSGFPRYLMGTRRMLEFVSFADLRGEVWTGAWVQAMYWAGMRSALLVMAPLLVGVMLAGVATHIGQVGPYFSWEAFHAGGLKALNPAKGLKRMFSAQTLSKLLITLLKIILIGGIVFLFWRPRWMTLAQLPLFDVNASVVWIGQNIYLTVVAILLLALVIAAIDVVTTRRRHERDMMMTKHEVKDERKQYEVNPEVKRTQFRKMRALTMSRLVASVPDATVVITNPTRVAVALKYDARSMDAPKVVAKGLRLRAARIRELAEVHGVPIVERPPLARTLYQTVDVGKSIPAALFEAVAEVLAYLHRLGRRLDGVAGGHAESVA